MCVCDCVNQGIEFVEYFPGVGAAVAVGRWTVAALAATVFAVVAPLFCCFSVSVIFADHEVKVGDEARWLGALLHCAQEQAIKGLIGFVPFLKLFVKIEQFCHENPNRWNFSVI